MLEVRPLITSLAWAFGGLSSVALIALPAAAQTTGGADMKLGRVEITGSSIKRIDAETALPVQILTREDIARSGVSSVEQLLKSITATSTFGAATVAGTGSGGGQGGNNSASSISLRGLGAARTLVLINGRRSAPANGGSAVDIASIPVASIDRVEVLRDGASAVYGSDAVAGVVNFILRRDFSGTEISATVGAPTRSGGGTEKRVSLFTGYGDFDKDGLSGTFSATYQTVDPIFGISRSFARNLDVENYLDKTSATATFPANVRRNNGTILAAPTYPNCGPFSIVSPLTPGVCRYDNAPYDALQPESKLGSLAASGRYKLNADLEAYGEVGLTQNKTINTIQHVLINGAALAPGSPYTKSLTDLLNTQYPQFPQLRPLIGFGWALLPPSSPYYPTAYANSNGLNGQPLVLQFRSIPTGVRMTEDVSENQRVVTGVRGTAAGWDVDAGALYSKNKTSTFLRQGWVDTDSYLKLVNTGVINPFGPTNDPAALAAAFATNSNGLFNRITQTVKGLDGKASREVFKLPAGPVSVALGAEFRKETLDIDPSDANRRGLVSGFGGIGGVATTGDRNITSGYVEVAVPVVKGVEVDAALRYDKYDNVGNTTNPKLSVRWQPTETLLFRGSAGTGFRAPTLLNLLQPQVQGVSTNGQRDTLRCPVVTPGNVDCSTQYNTLAGGNPALKPEKSRSATFGVVFEPTRDYSIGIDYFNVQVKETITAGAASVATILADPNRFSSLITRRSPDGNASGVGPVNFISQGLINLGKVKVSGVDVDLMGRILKTDSDRVTLRLNGTYFNKYDVQNTDGSYSSQIDSPGNGNIGVVIRWRHTASATWDTGPWSASLAQNYQNGYQDVRTGLQPASVPNRNVASYVTYDAQLNYSGIKDLRLTLGVKNLTDRNPPYTNYGGGFVGGYDLSYADVRGRFAYLTANYSFK